MAKRKRTTARSGQRGSTTIRHAAKLAVHKEAGVRSRVRTLTLQALRDGDLSMGEVPGLVKEILHGAAAGLDKAVPRSHRNVLRQVVDGLGDAVAAAASSTKKAARSFTQRGSKFVKRDVKRTTRELQQVEEQFLDAVQRAGRSMGRAARDEIDLIVAEGRRAGTSIRPGLRQTVKAADGRLLDLGRESAAASLRAMRAGVRTLLRGASGALEGVSDALAPSPSRSANPPRGRKKASKSTTRTQKRKGSSTRTKAGKEPARKIQTQKNSARRG